MKKFTIAILAIFYLTVSSGIAMSIHYCMANVVSVSLMHTEDEDGGCGMEKGCCKDEFKIVKLNDSHKLISNDIKIFTPELILNNSKTNLDTRLLANLNSSEFKNHSPPQSSGFSLNILYCVFRI